MVALTAYVPITIRSLLPASIPMEIVQSCNGLLLFKYYSSVHFIKLHCVCNLATKQHKFVPLPDFKDANPLDVTCFLAFDPSVSPHYKIVGVAQTYQYKFFIFSSETAQWKRTNVSIAGWMVQKTKAVYCKVQFNGYPLVFTVFPIVSVLILDLRT